MLFKSLRTFILHFLVLAGCQPGLRSSSPFEKGVPVGKNKNEKLEEASGLVASAANPGYLWTHNDSGNPAELFLLDNTKCSTKKVFRLSSIVNRDWEDISMGPGPKPNVNYLYIADIGDNLLHFPVKYIYRLQEPLLSDSSAINNFDTLIIKLSGNIHDAEAFMVDPISRNLYLVSKNGKNSNLYEIQFPFQGDTLMANKIFKLPLKTIVAADISPDGNEILMKDYEKIYYWKKKGNESLSALLNTTPVELDYDREPQGESIAWARDGSGFYTLGENAKGERSTLFFYKRKP